MKIYFSIFVLLSFLNSQSQSIHSAKKQEIFDIGYRNIILTDSARHYKPGAPNSNKLYYRPVEIDLWYPAIISNFNHSIRYGAFLNLLEERSNRFQDDTMYTSISSDLVQYLSANLKITDNSKLTQFTTKSYQNAKAATGKFPLIIYMCSFNGMSFENIQLFELLARHGYVVASITSVGAYPGNMSSKFSDAMEQVKDGEFAIACLKEYVEVDSTHIGTLGYSWGGLASMLLSKNNPSVKSILSFDGSEIHYYGASAEEDLDYDIARQLSYFNINKISIPYSYLESGDKLQDSEIDSIFNPLKVFATQYQHIHFIHASHEDFSGLTALAATINGSKTQSAELNADINLYALNYFDQTLKGANDSLQTQVAKLFSNHVVDSVYYTVSSTNRLIISGRVVDEKNNEVVSYVNIGVPGKNRGTVSGSDGTFVIKINSAMSVDSLLFSMAGYNAKMIAVKDLLKQKRPFIVMLREHVTELKEVIVSSKLLPEQIKGNTTKSTFVSIGLPLKFLGSETGIKIDLGKHPVLIKSFSFNINENRLDTAVFRLNIYNIKNGKPDQNILTQNILIKLGHQKGKFTIDLSDYNLVMKGDILLSLEWIEGAAVGKNNGAIFLSAGFLNSSTWHRLTSQGSWKKAGGLGISYNITVQKIPLRKEKME